MPEDSSKSVAPLVPTPSLPSRAQDFAFAAGLLALTAVVFWPAAAWLATQTFAQEQLKQSFFIVVLAGMWIAWEQRKTLSLHLRLSGPTLAWLSASYALAAGTLLFKTPLLVLAGLVAATGGFVGYVFGDRALRRTLPFLCVFGLLILCVLLLPILDWPLRQMAGVESVRLLRSLGWASQLAIDRGPPVQLLLLTKAQVFIVAPECNGFGLISSSFLLGTILLIYRRARAWSFALLLPLCVVLAFVFNLLRIFAIVVLAPRFPNHYFALHETAGQIALYSGLGLIWWLTTRVPSRAAA